MQKNDYKKVDAGVIVSLTGIVGAKNVLSDLEKMEDYCHDELPGLRHEPEAVVLPGNPAQVQELMRFALAENIPLTPRGRGTGLSGGALPLYGGIVLSLEKMEQVLDVDKANLMVVSEPGTITGQLQGKVEESGLFYPVDPASLEDCSIGGNVAENAGGPRAMKYGITRHYVCGLEVVTPDGEMISYGGKYVKNVAGYDLAQLMVGSEGTLGIITKIILRLIPLPQKKIDLLLPFNSLEQATRAVQKITTDKKITPTAIEFMERDAVKACEKFLKRELQYSDAAAQLIIELDGNDAEQIDRQAEAIGELAADLGCEDVLVADTPQSQERLWEARRSLLETLKADSPIVEVEDVTVPRAHIPQMVSVTKQLAEKHGVTAICFGHAGDGNIHVNLLKQELDDETWSRKLPQISEEIFRTAVKLGGTVTGEHGVGLVKKQALKQYLSSRELKLMQTLKKSLDPAMILNPGKIFDV